MYDKNHDGTIAYDEMLEIVNSVYKMVGRMVEHAEDEDTANKVRSDQACFQQPRCVLTKRTWVLIGNVASGQDLQEYGQG